MSDTTIIDKIKIDKDGHFEATGKKVTTKHTGKGLKLQPGKYKVNIEKSFDHIIDKEPLFSHLIRKLTVVEAVDCPSTATDGVNLLWNHDFLSSITPDEQCGVLLHEVLHCAFLHLWRKGKRDPMLWNIACVVGDTRIKMADGTEKEIKNIQEGEEVFGYQDGKVVKGKVLLTFSKEADTMELNIDNNRLISTREHKILTQEGFKEAGEIYEGESVAVATNRERVHIEELYDHDNCGNGKKIGSWLPQCRRFSSSQRSLQKQNNHQSQEAHAKSALNTASVGLFGRLGRWGRDGNDSKNLQKLLSSFTTGCKYFYASLKANGRLGVLGNFSTQLQWSPILADRVVGVPNQGDIGNFRTTINNKKTVSTFDNRVYNNSSFPKTQRQTNRKDVGNLSKNKDFEYQRVTNKKDTGRCEKVYDLVTDCHSYIANNVVVHNCDYAINLIVNRTFPLPDGTLLDTQYADMSAEEIYDKLPIEDVKEQGWCQKDGWEGQGQGDQDGDGKGKNPIKKLIDDVANGAKRKAEEQAKAKAKQKSAGQKESDWSGAFDKALTQNYGKAPEYIKRIISQKHYIPVIDWGALVSKILSEDITDYTFSQPDRRFLDEPFILPDLYSWDRVKDVVFAYDTSGSISQDDLNAFHKETISLWEHFPNLTGWAGVCDWIIHSFKEISPDVTYKEINFKGGGGTSFEPVFEEVEKRNLHPKAMFYFTDTYGSFPKDPGYPVFWLVHSYIGDSAQYRVPFGQVIKFMNKSQLNDPMKAPRRW